MCDVIEQSPGCSQSATRTPTGMLLFQMMGAIAEFENALRHERQMDGIARAKAKGVRFGHKHRLTPERITA